MDKALREGNYTAYEKARSVAKDHMQDDEKRLFRSHKPSVQERQKEIESLVLTERPKRITHLSLVKKGSDFVVGESKWSTSPADSGSRCLECQRFVTAESIKTTWDGDNLVCPNCNKKTPVGMGGAYLTQQALDNLDANVTKNTIWYHATTDPDWYNTLNSVTGNPPVVHAGTKLAAWMRAKTFAVGDESKPFYLYEVRLNDSSEVSEMLYDDEDEHDYETPMHPKSVKDTEELFETGKVMRYVNWWEDTGSVSVMASPSLFSASKGEVMDLSLPYKD